MSREDVQSVYLRKQLETMKEINTKLDTLRAAAETATKSFQSGVVEFTKDVRDTINKRFDAMPKELSESDSIKRLRQELLKDVDDKIAEALKAQPPK